jgi:SAM-dependent methyltransferase
VNSIHVSRINQIRSRQGANPTGLLGRIIGRVMVKDTAESNDRALELLNLSAPSTVLEIGYGQGRTVARLIQRGHRVIGVDVSQTMVNQATARNRQACRDGRATLALGDGGHLPFDDQAADCAFTAHTLYFMPEPQNMLNEVARVLRPGGRLVIACRVSDDPIPSWMDPTIYRIPSVAEVVAMLNIARFTGIAHHAGNESSHFTHWFVGDLAKP